MRITDRMTRSFSVRIRAARPAADGSAARSERDNVVSALVDTSPSARRFTRAGEQEEND